jgi:glycerol dehydrogenase-like iron-containing ADH family enzyme
MQVLEFASEVGLPLTLSDIGLGDLDGDMLNGIAERSSAKGETIHNEPFEGHSRDGIRRYPPPLTRPGAHGNRITDIASSQ